MSIPVYYTTPQWHKLRKEIIARDEGRCFYCGEQASTADHVIPRGKNGPDHPANLVACCLICNTIAGGRVFRDREKKKSWITRERKRLTKRQRGQRAFNRSHYEETMRLLRKKQRHAGRTKGYTANQGHRAM